MVLRQTIGSRDVYLVRHGETGLNRIGYIRGHANPPLDTAGLAQACALGHMFARVHPVKITSSPLARAVQTATAIAEAADLGFENDPRLIDRDFGRWTGFLEARVAARWGTADRAPGVETDAAIVVRVMPAVEEAVCSAGTGPVILVTHDAVIRALLVSLDLAVAGTVIPTGSWTLLRRSAAGWEAASVGNGAPALAHAPRTALP